MVANRIAIIGGGASGLVAAKSALEWGLEPVLFEARHHTGGLWTADEGLVWNTLHTNLSKWSCSFSDHPWPNTAADFPAAGELLAYLASYKKAFGLDRVVRAGCAVKSVDRENGAWKVVWQENGATHGESFAHVIVAAGVFGKAYVPPIAGLETYEGTLIHSASYKDAARFKNMRVGVVGSSFSAVEIACDLAAAGREVVLMFRRSQWILPRYMPGSGVPLDLALYARGAMAPDPNESAADVNRRRANYFAATFGNPGDVHPALHVEADEGPPFVAISDDLARHVASRRITPVKSREFTIGAKGPTTAEGADIACDALILCTGFDCDLTFLDRDVLTAIAYRRNDRFVPFVANKAVLHPDVPGVAFVGMYRGPYFAVMELQARWATGVLSGAIAAPSRQDGLKGVTDEAGIRAQVPQPQFPHANYVEFADSLGREIGVIPEATQAGEYAKMLDQGPCIPAHYRLLGPHARPDVALPQIEEVWQRMGLAWN